MPAPLTNKRDRRRWSALVIPIKEPVRQTYKELDARNAKAPERFDVKAPKGAPNVVVILIDDIGFGASNHFGGPINMPVLDKLGKNGLKL